MNATDAAVIGALAEFVGNVLDTNDMVAEFMDTAAIRLRNGDSPHRIAHYLEQNARTVRQSRRRVQDKLCALADEDEPTNALRAYLSKPDARPSEQRDPRGDADNGR